MLHSARWMMNITKNQAFLQPFSTFNVVFSQIKMYITKNELLRSCFQLLMLHLFRLWWILPKIKIFHYFLSTLILHSVRWVMQNIIPKKLMQQLFSMYIIKTFYVALTFNIAIKKSFWIGFLNFWWRVETHK